MYATFLTTLKVEHRDHQQEAVEWAVNIEKKTRNNLFNEGANGGFIADDMGLGKTIVATGIMYMNKKQTLVVVPSILLQQWEERIKQLTPNYIIFHGYKHKKITQEQLSQAEVVLTTYGLCSSSKLQDIIWQRIVCDEAHHMRNSNTINYIYMLKLRGDIRWAFTGTPIQNSHKDMMSICRFLQLTPDVYVTKEVFNKTKHLFMLRRTKADVGINLPKLSHNNIKVEWESEQEKALAKKMFNYIQIGKKKPNDPNKLFDRVPGPFTMLPLMFIKEYDSTGREKQKKGEKLKGLIQGHQFCIHPIMLEKLYKTMVDYRLVSSDTLDVIQNSSKMNKIVETISTHATNGNKKLVFCSFIKEMEILEERLRRECEGLSVNVLNGRKTQKERAEIMAKKPDILLMQIQMGCEGLNMQEYSEIYFSSPSWNPALYDQALGRCHRFGQTKPVNVYNFYMDEVENESYSSLQEQYSESELELFNERPQQYVMDTYMQKRQSEKRTIISSYI